MAILQKRNGQLFPVASGSGGSNKKLVMYSETRPTEAPDDLEENGLIIVGESSGNIGSGGTNNTEFVSGIYNTREVLTTSGTWTAPITGWYKVTCIGGGGGGSAGLIYNTQSMQGGGGGSGGEKVFYRYMQRGFSMSYTIGAGGIGGRNVGDNVGLFGTDGGSTAISFGDGVTHTITGGTSGRLFQPASSSTYYTMLGGLGGSYNNEPDTFGFNGENGVRLIVPTAGGGNTLGAIGGGKGGGVTGAGEMGTVSTRPPASKAKGYGAGGAGGSAYAANTAESDSLFNMKGTDGMQGAIILEYYDPNKTE